MARDDRSADLRLGNLSELPVVAAREGQVRPRNFASASLLSAVLHLVLLLVLSLLILPVTVGSNVLVTAMFGDDQDLELLELTESSDINIDSDDFVVQELTTAAVLATLEVPDVDLMVPEIELASLASEPNEPAETIAELRPSAAKSAEASSVEDAVDGITAKILGELEKGDLLVVWLLDASHSLVDDRHRVAARLKPFFLEIAARRTDGTLHQLRNAVVSFGKNSTQRVAPTEFGKRIVNAVGRMPVDSSGKENVFAAVSQSAADFRASWGNKQLMLVIWTDESGDDVELLESTIADCRRYRASVSVVGPSSILGAETGLHAYRDPKKGTIHQLPVTRGPDSAFPERVELGYWFHSGQGFPPPVFGDAHHPPWHGGPDLQGIASGFSPYALTRLAIQTGGFYTIFDRAEDRPPFDRLELRGYAPDYRAAEKYFEDLSLHPLRQAVVDAVKVTRGKRLGSPELMLFVVRDKKQPAEFDRPYFTAKQFYTKLRASRRALDRKANLMAGYVEQALVHVSKSGQGDQPLDDEYRQEASPRWRAWYDLTRGRLLATSVRLQEYRLALDAIAEPGALQSTTNHVIFFPSPNLRSDERFQSRAAEAERRLRRCVQNNPDTAWASLAQRELDRALGIFAQELSLTPTPSIPGRARPSLPRF